MELNKIKLRPIEDELLNLKYIELTNFYHF